MDTLPFDYLVKLCSDFYSESEIDSAKEIVSKLGPTEKRYPRRKGQYKKVSTMQDILRIMPELKTSLIPVYVARDLGNLPPLSYEHFDVSKLLHDIEVVRNEVNLIKFSIPSIPSNILELRPSTSSVQNNDNPKNSSTERVQSCLTSERNISGAKSVSAENNTSSSKTSRNKDTASDVKDTEASTRILNGILNGKPSVKTNVVTNAQSQVESIKNDSVVQEDQPWTVVTTRRTQKKLPFVSGTAKSVVGGLQIARKTPRRKCLGIFVSRLHEESTADQVKDHVMQKSNLNIKVKKLETKFKTYSSFLVETDFKHVHSLLVPDFWPEGALIKHYYE